MKKMPQAFRLGKISAALAFALCTLPVAYAEMPSKSFAEMMKELPLVPAGAQDSDILSKISLAVGFIKRMELPQAQAALNEALQLDPRSSYLHFLNGFSYHLQARQGDTQKNDLALEGYQQALRIDPSNWIAREFLGLVHMDLKQYDRAKLAFSDVLLMTPDSGMSMYGLMVASYLTGDASTACSMADQYQKTSNTGNRNFIRSSIAVYASCGQFSQAEGMRESFKQMGESDFEVARADRRLTQWRSFYLKHDQAKPEAQNTASVKIQRTSLAQTVSAERPMQLAQAFTVPSSPYVPSSSAATATPASPRPAAVPRPVVSVVPAVATVPVAPEASQVSNSANSPSASPASVSSSTIAATALPSSSNEANEGPRMALIDVVLLSTQELASSSKGINLLNALTFQLGSIVAPGTTAAYSRITTVAANPALAASTTITRAVTIPALSYSLNIANANNSVNEVLARPTLAAIEGLPSEFFSGTNLSAGVVSTSLQGGTTVVPLDKRFGIKLSVTPTFLSQGRVQLKVEAQRTALNASSDNPRVAYQIEIGEITASANVVMNLGETLVLSGLSEKSSSSVRDGVPGLQDVPVVQYLFSNKKTNELQRSVLILVTPRAPVQIADATAEVGESMVSRMKTLRNKFGFSNSTPANIEAVMNQLQSNEFFREFRQGDVTLERWERMRSTGDRLREAVGFLYY